MFWRVTEFLIEKKEYRILRLSKNQEELWLEKIEDKQVQLIRLLRYNLDWGSRLQRDIEMTASAGEQARKQWRKGELKILNLYFSPYPPVDDYQFRLAEPYKNTLDGKVEVRSLLIERAKGLESLKEIEALFDDPIPVSEAEEYPDEKIEAMKKNALYTAMNRAKKEKDVFNYGKPVLTYLFMAIQIIVFLLMEAYGGSTETATLIKFGAKFNPLMIDGEWWRFFSPIFIHIGLLHLFMNTLALYYLGVLVEKLYGSFRFFLIYISAGFVGVLASFIVNPNLSAGASGAIFGCFGALLYFGTAKPSLFWRTMGLNVLVVMGINLAFGFTVPGIDNAGHIGGLIGGFVSAGILQLPKTHRPFQRILFLLAFVVLVIAGLQYGFSSKSSVVDERSVLVLTQQYIQEEEYQKAYELLSAFDQSRDPSPDILFMLSFTEIKQGRLKDAKEHLLEAIELDPELHQAYFNLSLLYLDENNLKDAYFYAEKAVTLNPDENRYKKTLEQIRRAIESSG